MLRLFVFLALMLIPKGWASQQKVLLQSDSNPFTREFEKLANETLAHWHVPGLSIGIVDGENEWSAGYGISHFPSAKVIPSTLFYTGSTTKAFVASLVSLLVDNGTFRWNTPISSIIRDDFVLSEDYATHHVTIEDALSHRTGLPRHEWSYGGIYEKNEGSLRDIVRSIRWLPLTEELRTKFQYCNIMYMVMSYVIEKLKVKWLGDLLYEHIWQPLEMESTYFSTPAAQAGPEDLAQGYIYLNSEYKEVPYMNLTLTSGAGSVISNVLDYNKWLKALINRSAPLSETGHRAIRTPRSFDTTEGMPLTGPVSYTLGWNTGVYHGYEFFTHSGGMEAFGALVIFFPALKYGVSSFGNTAVTANWVEERLVWQLIDDKIGVPMSERFNWTKLRESQQKEKIARYENATQRHYPSLPTPRLPLSLPFANYTGTYYHPAYRNFTVVLNPETNSLHIDRTKQQLWKSAIELKHISGDYFMAYADSTTAPGSIFKEAVPAQFRIGGDGIVASFGIRGEEMMGEEKIWFERV